MPAVRRLDRGDFNQPTLRVARDLLGKFIVRRIGTRVIAAMIVETEAYKGPADRAAHTHGGRRTPRVEPLWQDGGTAYVYLCYGIHWLLNFSTAGAGKPEGVLIRGIVTDGRHALLGPGKVTRHLQVDRRLDGVDVTVSKALWVEDRGVPVARRSVLRGPRIGVDYAGPDWAGKPWRFRIAPPPR
ncbi:MAG: DNA-3-methyladenine glycosylase [Burkholderiales bacterium]